MKLLILVFLAIQFCAPCGAQDKSFPINEWVEMLGVQRDIKQAAFWEIVDSLSRLPDGAFYAVLDKLGNKAPSDKRFQIRVKLLRAALIYRKGNRIKKYTEKISRVVNLLREAILEAYKINDEMLVAQGSAYYGMVMYNNEYVAPGLMYCQNAIEIQNRIGIDNFMDAAYLRYVHGLLLFRVREYADCIDNMNDALNLQLEEKGHFFPMNAWNTIGLAFAQQHKEDSALWAYDRAMEWAVQFKDTLWIGIVSGNRAHILFERGEYDSAAALLAIEYASSVRRQLLDNAANSLRWSAKIHLVHGKKKLALHHLHEASALLSKHPQAFLSTYKANICQSYADVYHALNMNDSSFHYLNLYMHIRDSLNLVVEGTKAELASMILENRNSVDTIQRIQKQKDAEKATRNYIIGGLLVLLMAGVFLFIQLRIKLKHKQQLAEQQHLLSESKVKSSQQQLELFTKNIREKTALIQDLQSQMEQQQNGEDQQRLTQILLNHGILTQEDWKDFKHNFEEIYPSFLIILKKRAPDVTSAELRLAALTKLQLGSREIAAVLGISTSSVYKSRQRLRQRLQLDSHEAVERFIAGIC